MSFNDYIYWQTLQETGKTPEEIYEYKHPEVVRCEDCRKSHIDGKTTHYLWCTEWGRSTDTFGYCERGEREGDDECDY